MTCRFVYRSVLATMIVLRVVAPAKAQMIVFDTSNYTQNALQAARALQQINNQIASLGNQTQMLANQLKNLERLPYSSLQAIEQSISRTQQLLAQTQRVAYDINQIDQTFQRYYPRAYASSTARSMMSMR